MRIQQLIKPRHKKMRPTVWDSSVSASHEGSFIPVLTAGVSYLKAQIADALDEQLLCQHGRGSATLGHEATYRESKA